METYIKKAEDLEAVNNNFIPPLLDAILGDYTRNVPAARDAEVLNVMATITGRLGVCLFTLYRWSTALTVVILAPINTSCCCYLGRSVRADAEHDQPRLCGVPRAPSWILQITSGSQSQLFPRSVIVVRYTTINLILMM